MDTPPRSFIVAVNGYGAPRKTDEHLRRYVAGCLSGLELFYNLESARLDSLCTFVFLGGRTNRRDRSEAQALRTAFEEAFGAPLTSCHLIDNTMSSRENIEVLSDWCDEWKIGNKIQIHLFCHTNRITTTRAFVRNEFGHDSPIVNISGVNFDGASPTWRDAIKHWLELAAMHIGGPFEWLRMSLRTRHVEKARAKADAEDFASQPPI